MTPTLKKPDPTWLDVDEAARELGISRTTLFRLRKQGKVKPVNDNPLLDRPRTLYFTREELQRLRQQAQGAQS